MEIMSFIADICGIISFVVSVALWFKFDRIKVEIEKQRLNYTKEQNAILYKLNQINDYIADKSINQDVVNALGIELEKFLIKFPHLLSLKDKIYVKSALRLLNKKLADSNKKSISKKLRYLIARFHKDETSESYNENPQSIAKSDTIYNDEEYH